MDNSKYLLKSSILVLALGVMPLPSVAATMQAVFTGYVRNITDGEPLGLTNVESTFRADSGERPDRVNYTARYVYDTDLATAPDEDNISSVPILSSSITINGHTFELGSGRATYMPYIVPDVGITWAQYNTSTDFVDQQTRFSGSMGQRAFFYLPESTSDYSASNGGPNASEPIPDFGYEFFTDEFRSHIYWDHSSVRLAEYDLQTGATTSQTFALLFEETMQVSSIPLPASFPILLCAIGTLGLLGRRKHASS